jgi:hypothetical protein
LENAARIVVSCDPFCGQLFYREDVIPGLWPYFHVLESDVSEDGSMNLELDLQILRVRDLLRDEVG